MLQINNISTAGFSLLRWSELRSDLGTRMAKLTYAQRWSGPLGSVHIYGVRVNHTEYAANDFQPCCCRSEPDPFTNHFLMILAGKPILSLFEPALKRLV